MAVDTLSSVDVRRVESIGLSVRKVKRTIVPTASSRSLPVERHKSREGKERPKYKRPRRQRGGNIHKNKEVCNR